MAVEGEAANLKRLAMGKREIANHISKMITVEEVVEVVEEAEEVVEAAVVGVGEAVTSVATTKITGPKVTIRIETMKKPKMQDLRKPKASLMAAKTKNSQVNRKCPKQTKKKKLLLNKVQNPRHPSKNKMTPQLILILSQILKVKDLKK